METYKIILYLIIILVSLLMMYAVVYNKIKTQILKINSAESRIDESLRSKYDLIIKLITEIKSVDKENKDFKSVDNLKDKDLSSFEFERELTDIESKIYTIKNDNNKLLKSSSFTEGWHEIINLNTIIKGEEKYYNENTTIYNNLVSKFPSNIVAKTMKLKIKKYFDGKDLYDKNIKDFKI